jgi:hypothetical protein
VHDGEKSWKLTRVEKKSFYFGFVWTLHCQKISSFTIVHHSPIISLFPLCVNLANKKKRSKKVKCLYTIYSEAESFCSRDKFDISAPHVGFGISLQNVKIAFNSHGARSRIWQLCSPSI